MAKRRPRRSPYQATAITTFRLTPREKSVMRAAASREGQSLSAWVREAVEARLPQLWTTNSVPSLK